MRISLFYFIFILQLKESVNERPGTDSFAKG